MGLKIFFSLKPKMVFYDLSSSYFEGEGPEESAGFGNGPDGSGGFREKRFGLAPGGLCSGTGGWSVPPTWAFFGAKAMGFWWDFRQRRSPEVLEYLRPEHKLFSWQPVSFGK